MSPFPPVALICVYGDEVVELDDWKSKGTMLPGRDLKVKTRQLGAHVCAVALWSLERQGNVRLEVQEKRRLGIRMRKVLVSTTGTGTAYPGVETELARLVARLAPRDAGDVVKAWLEQDMSDPHGYVVRKALLDGLPSGLLQEVDSGRSGVSALVRGRTMLVPRQDTAPAARAAFDEVMGGWRHVQLTRGELAPALVERCMKGLNIRVESTDAD